ncbi:hypothetical protein [Novosphingobium sp.]|uniref:hypothetical protein n=1 Tax=Novosphingobium sp. TaxID=1874826 RepID=UPI002FD9E1C1
MGNFSMERRARFVMFLGVALLGIFIFFHEMIEDSLGYDGRWVIENGWLHALAAALILFGAWKWLNAREDSEKREAPKCPPKDRGQELLDDLVSSAKMLGAKTPREAAQMAMGRRLPDDEWSEVRAAWEEHW